MATDILNPRELSAVLELYGIENAAFLSIFLCCYDLNRNSATEIDAFRVIETLSSESTMDYNHWIVVLAIAYSDLSQILVLRKDEIEGELLILLPGDNSSVETASFYGTEKLVHAFQDSIQMEHTRMMARTSH